MSPEQTPPPTQPVAPLSPDTEKALGYIVPINCSGWAIAAGYLALFNIILLPLSGPLSIVFGILGLRAIRKNPKLRGRVRCWFAIISSAALILLIGVLILLAVAQDN